MGLLDRLDPDPERKEKASQQREAAYSRHEGRQERAKRKTREKSIDWLQYSAVGIVTLVVWPFKLVIAGGKYAYARGEGDGFDIDFSVMSSDGRNTNRWRRD